MLRTLQKTLKQSESGQTMIFVAIIASILMGVMGLAVEGGRVFVTYRSLQSAVDMAAIVGAQKLPCGTTDTSCIQTAQDDACTYLKKNGYGGGAGGSGTSCTAGTGVTAWASAPPQSCSPYDFIDYGNQTAACNHHSAPPFYDYIETSVTDSLGTIPIFNIPVQLTAHAVAKHGIGTPSDFALETLSPTVPMTIGQGSNTTTLDGSAFANGGISGGGSEACGGGWYSAGTITGVTTNSSTTSAYSPPGCGSSTDATPVEQGSLPPITDPYSGSVAPPSQAASFPNCTMCTAGGYWWDGSSWGQGGTPSVGNGGKLELFPGTYTTLSVKNKASVYFNPGVYTFTGGLDTNHGNMCVFGAPTCDSSTCGSTEWSTGSSTGNSWMYSCSMWGFWDSKLSRTGAPGGGPSLTGPTWYDASTSSATSVPLNGVTIYLPANAGGVNEQGNGGKNGGQYLAAPNPCAGTGSFSTGSVSFPAGHVLTGSENFDYTGSYAASVGLPTTTQQVYPSMDLSLLGECTLSQTYEVWPGEMPKPQHLHFLFWLDPTGNNSGFTGASGQDWFGIMYAPGSSISLHGAGKGAGGPPWVTGQIVASSVDWTGNSYSDIYYRPCGAGATACGSGRGTQLIQ